MNLTKDALIITGQGNQVVFKKKAEWWKTAAWICGYILFMVAGLILVQTVLAAAQ